MKRRIITLFICIALLVPTSAFAQDAGVEQYQYSLKIGGTVDSAVLIVGYKKDAADIKKLVDIVVGHANEALALLDENNSSSDIAKLNAAAGGAAVTVGWQTIECLAQAVKASKMTDTDLLAAPGSQGSYKDVAINEGATTVQLKKAGMKIRTSAVRDGYLADILLRYINAGGMQNVMVKVGNVFRGIGVGLHSPWKIQVQEDSTTYAKHALNIPIANTAIATVSSTDFPGKMIYDPSAGRDIAVPIKGATIIMAEGALAQGVATAVMIAGPVKGMKLLNDVKGSQGLIVDPAGKFLRKGL